MLALAGYEEERRKVAFLPAKPPALELSSFAKNGLGVAAYENGRMAGFLCCTNPFDHAFRSTNVCGVFSPMGANAAVPVNREKIYAAMYQSAARKWVLAGAVSHGICLYAHDTASQRQFFRYGFGLRCVDSIRLMVPDECHPCGEYEVRELAIDEYQRVYPLYQKLNEFFCSSPIFINRDLESQKDFCDACERDHLRYFAAISQGEMCAYLEISGSGETVLSENPGYQHVSSAFCLESHRGKGLYRNLLNYTIGILQKEGYTHLGVDFESLNPAASNFWSKHFAAYTHGVVRRIDERILKRRAGRE